MLSAFRKARRFVARQTGMLQLLQSQNEQRSALAEIKADQARAHAEIEAGLRQVEQARCAMLAEVQASQERAQRQLERGLLQAEEDRKADQALRQAEIEAQSRQAEADRQEHAARHAKVETLLLQAQHDGGEQSRRHAELETRLLQAEQERLAMLAEVKTDQARQRAETEARLLLAEEDQRTMHALIKSSQENLLQLVDKRLGYLDELDSLKELLPRVAEINRLRDQVARFDNLEGLRSPVHQILCDIQFLLARLSGDPQEALDNWRRSIEMAEASRISGPTGGGAALQDSGRGAPRAPTAEDWRPLEEKGLFVVGSARSGTTIFARCLNLSKQVYLLEEPDLFVRQAEPDFVSFFNERHRNYGNFEANVMPEVLRHKGAYIPPAMHEEKGACELLNRIGLDHAYVGEKLAIGARPHGLPDDWHARCLEFYTRNFYRSNYFVTIRRPSEVAWSMRKMWPTHEASSYLECWLLSLDFMVDLYLSLERVHVCFFDRFSPAAMEAVARILKIELELPPDMISDTKIKSALDGGQTPGFLMHHDSVCQGCEELYRVLRENFSAESFRYCGAASREHFFRGVKKSVAELLEGLVAQSPGSARGGRRLIGAPAQLIVASADAA